VPFLGSVPLDAQVRVGGDTGAPIIVTHPDSPAAAALSHIAGEVARLIDETAASRGDGTIPLTTID
jgi:MinD-like ATPase involved in chromosome partitioning or flagellar assembly